jgi:hypothetical protein
MGGGLASLPGGGGCRGEGARGAPLILKLEAKISDHSATAGNWKSDRRIGRIGALVQMLDSRNQQLLGLLRGRMLLHSRGIAASDRRIISSLSPLPKLAGSLSTFYLSMWKAEQ